MGGAETIQAQGFAQATGDSPNRRLLCQLFVTTRSLYRYLALVVFVLVGAWGTYMVEMRVTRRPSPLLPAWRGLSPSPQPCWMFTQTGR